MSGGESEREWKGCVMRMKETRVWMEEGIEGKQKEMREKSVGKKV